jgi:hypothetical protein
MSKSRRLLIGILSLLPLLLIVVYTITFFSIFISAVRQHGQPDALPGMMLDHIVWIVVIALLMGFSSLAMLIFFIVHAINNTAIDSTERLVWVLVFIFAGIIGGPVYWYMRIWKSSLPPVA